MQLQDILYSQGFGTRRVCAGLVQQGFVTVGGEACDDSAAEFDPEGLQFTVQGKPWPYHDKAYILLHKPAGTECSQKPSTWPSIYTLLPAPLRQRPQKGPVQGVQAVTVLTHGAHAGVLSDVASKPLFISGSKDWRSAAKKMNLTEALLIDDSGTVHLTAELQKRLEFTAKTTLTKIEP